MGYKEIFFRKISVDPKSGCWNWQGSKVQKGYGQAWDGEKVKLAHRLSYELHRGPIADGMCVCHHCDNPACVNPAHLFIGTNSDNMADKVTKGRQSRKLSDSEVRQIRAAVGIIQQDLATQFGVGQDEISRIRSGKRWKRLGMLQA